MNKKRPPSYKPPIRNSQNQLFPVNNKKLKEIKASEF